MPWSGLPRPLLSSFLLPSWRNMRSNRPHLEERDPIWGDNWSHSPFIRLSPSWSFLGFSSAVIQMPGNLCTAPRIISLATDVTNATLGASGLWLGTRTGAGGTATQTIYLETCSLYKWDIPIFIHFLWYRILIYSLNYKSIFYLYSILNLKSRITLEFYPKSQKNQIIIIIIIRFRGCFHVDPIHFNQIFNCPVCLLSDLPNVLILFDL